MTEITRQKRPRWQRLLMLLVLILLLVAVNALYTPAESWRGVLAAEPGDVLYVAGFDGFNEDWVQTPGLNSQEIVDGKMRLSLGAVETIFSEARPYFEDFDVRVTATTVDGPIDNAYGLIFRLEEDERSCTIGIILCDLSQSGIFGWVRRMVSSQIDAQPRTYYRFLISADGYYSLWQSAGDTERRVSTWIASDLIRTGLDAENQIRVLARGNQFQFFINGQSVELCIPDNPEAESTYTAGTCLEGQMRSVWENADYTRGQIGVLAEATFTGGAGVVVEFDNFIVTQPDDGSDVEVDRT